jgi:insecticidal toxin complex protein TccC
MLAAGQAILYRRANELPEDQRREFQNDFSAMIDFTKNAISALTGPDLTPSTQEKLKNIFGPSMDGEHLNIAANAARKKLKKVLRGALKDQAKGDRFVFTDNNPLKPEQRAHWEKSTSQGINAIYLNLKGREQSAPINAATIFHELSHVHARTKDFWYLFSDSSPGDSEEMIDANINAALQRSLTIATNGPDLSKIKPKSQKVAVKLIEREQKDPRSPVSQAWNAQIAITTHNADSLTALALQFRPRQLH